MLIHGFPYKRVEQESDIIIYGCGVVGKEYIAQVEATKWCHIHYIIDNGRNAMKYNNIPVMPYGSFTKHVHQNVYIIVIAIADRNAADAIIAKLQQDGIPGSQIVWEDIVIKMPVECTKNAVMFDANPIQIMDNEMICIQKQMINNNVMISEIPRAITNCGKKEEFVKLMEKFTNTNKYNYLDMSRLVNLMLNMARVIENMDGSVAELGVYQGDTASVLAQLCQKKNKKLFLLDTFEGFYEDDLVGIDQSKEKSFGDTSLSYVKDIIGNTENVYFIKGYFPDSVKELPKEEKYCFVHIDCDLYYPIKSGLEYFWPRIVKGGIIMVHDYSSGHWEGATQAVDEFCILYKVFPVMIPDLSGSVLLVKT